MTTPQFPESGGASDALSVTVQQSSPPPMAERGAASDTITVTRWVLPPVPPQGTPANANPYFTASGAGWTPTNGTFTVTSTPPAGCPQPLAGVYANNGITPGAMEETGSPVPLIANTSVLVTAWVYTTAPSVSIGFDWLNASLGYISTATIAYPVPPGTWVQLAYAVNPPWASAPAWARPRVGAGTLGATVSAAAVIVTHQQAAVTSPAPAVFVRSAMPVMHCQNLITGQWLHRDVQGITSPSVTWALNAADSYTCTLSPPRPDMMTAAGEPLLTEWRDACYLEEDGQIRFGGILTSSTFDGPSWTQTWTGFAAYPNGQTYEGINYTATRVDAMTVVRYLWNWTMAHLSDIGMTLPAANAGVLLGAQLPAVPLSDKLNAPSKTGGTTLSIAHPDPWRAGMVIRVGDEGSTYVIKSMSGHIATLTTKLRGASGRYVLNAVVYQVLTPEPFTLNWWNSTDIGNEIDMIRTEAVFDWREAHRWSGPDKAGVTHHWVAGVPRLGSRRTDLRFCEGENITAAVVTRDGSQYADRVIALGYGSGSATIRAEANDVSGRLHRTFVFTDAALQTTARASAAGRKVLASMVNIDAVTSVTVINHPHAPFGSFQPGDDILVQLCTGWRHASIWSRITSITQDPTTSVMTLGLARSDSFTYLAESGQGGTL
jgi:hypothetical protein